MVQITDTMTEEEYSTTLDEEFEESRRRYGDESRIFEKGYDYRPSKVRTLRPPFNIAKAVQSTINENLGKTLSP